ncbi:MAG: hypothetical protein OER12_06480 [Acidimicrobiia bacterium]|nr:hypothetical protein [Acidimicrobiia bacterium]
MRGTGYAIGEILIFLAIATIIGFLVGWLVFYRRPNNGSKLAPSNPNHVRQLETRAKAVETKMTNLDKKATAALAALAKIPRQAPPVKPAEAKDAVAKAADTKKDVAQKADTAKDAVAAKATDTKKGVAEKTEGIDGYISEADDRISKLEDTLDKLSEKLAELDDE